jgi:hypothetical protein
MFTCSLVPVLSHINPVHITLFCLPYIHFNIIRLFTYYVLVFLVVFFLLDFPPLSLMYSSNSPLVATCPVHLIFFDLISLIILSGEYKLRYRRDHAETCLSPAGHVCMSLRRCIGVQAFSNVPHSVCRNMILNINRRGTVWMASCSS